MHTKFQLRDHDFKNIVCNKSDPEVAEIEMLSFTLGVSRMDSMKNEQIKGDKACQMCRSQSQRGQTEVVCNAERRDSEQKDAEFGTGTQEAWMEAMKLAGGGDELVMNDF